MKQRQIGFRDLLERLLPIEELPPVDRMRVQRALRSGVGSEVERAAMHAIDLLEQQLAAVDHHRRAGAARRKRALRLGRRGGAGEWPEHRHAQHLERAGLRKMLEPARAGGLADHAFGLEPHSSFVNAFASFGWFGAFAFILLCAMTAFIGFRMCFKVSPYRPYAQMFFPPTLAIMLQGFQIDIDHWRHLFMFWGIIWGLETARWRWMARTRRAAMANS